MASLALYWVVGQFEIEISYSCSGQPANHLLITACAYFILFNYNNSGYDLTKQQVSFGPLCGARNFKMNFASREVLKMILFLRRHQSYLRFHEGSSNGILQ